MAKIIDEWALFHKKYVDLQERYEELLKYTIDLQKRHIEVIDEQIGILQRATEAEESLKRILSQPGCNDCAAAPGNQCGMRPDPGDDIRINCYMHTKARIVSAPPTKDPVLQFHEFMMKQQRPNKE